MLLCAQLKKQQQHCKINYFKLFFLIIVYREQLYILLVMTSLIIGSFYVLFCSEKIDPSLLFFQKIFFFNINSHVTAESTFYRNLITILLFESSVFFPLPLTTCLTCRCQTWVSCSYRIFFLSVATA